MLEAIITSSCSPDVHPIIVNAIVKTESNYNPFAIGVNRGAGRLTRQPTNMNEAVQTAKRLIANGANIDMGLGQINSANLTWLGLSVEQVMHPCTNLQALQKVYLTCYNQAGTTGLGDRMQRAFSCYNTGNTRKGFSNGYVTKATNNLNDLIARATNSNQHLTQTTHTAKNAPRNAVELQKTNLGTKPPSKAQNADMSVSVRSDDISVNPTSLENELVVENPVKVFNGWDVFRDF